MSETPSDADTIKLLVHALQEQRRQMDFPGLPEAFALTMKRMIDSALAGMTHTEPSRGSHRVERDNRRGE